MRNVFKAIEFEATNRPVSIAVLHSRGVVTYGRLLSDVNDFARELLAHGLGEGDLIAIGPHFPYENLVCLLASMRLGIASASVTDDVIARARDGFLATLGFTAFVAHPDASVELAGLRTIRIAPDWREHRVSAPGAGLPPPADTGSRLQRIVFSSGTTGTPKGAMFSADALARRLDDSILWYDLSSQARTMPMIGMAAGPGFWWSVGTLACGGVLILPPDFNSFPASPLDYAESLGVTHMICSPIQLSMMVRAGAKNVPSLRRLDAQGSHFPVALATQVRLLITPYVYFQYGSTETGSIATGSVSQRLIAVQGSGYVRPDAELEILDERGARQPAGVPGVIRMRSQSMSDGYLGDSGDSAFREGWFYPGDVGVLEPDGVLRVLGRVDEVMNVGGVKVSPFEVERLAREFPNVVDAAACALRSPAGPDEIWVGVVVNGVVDTDNLRAAVVEKLGKPVAGVRVIDQVPRNENGKVRRGALAAALAAASSA